ncbi:CCA tRNA nucleotidyltransferase, partial [Candidatus Bathyarchaeota archaeon]|nr:CCA tRNA nucleotidyltransferase [Candidatus Bathyarchaeota archaeon]
MRPNTDEIIEVERFCTKIIKELSKRLEEEGIATKVETHGSVARGTWISGDKDVDLFIILDPSLDGTYLHKTLDVVKGYLGTGWTESYAEHPYIRAKKEGFDVEFIPCFNFDPSRSIISSTDRTPLHTQYVNHNLKTVQRDEVRLLKQFMRGVGVYGAEVKIGGFSGYLCELLIIKFESFESTLKAASSWKHSEAINLIDDSNPSKPLKKFKDPLIVPDPVDPKRNVASAVSERSMWTFVAAARSFLKNPHEKYFYPEKVEADESSILPLFRENSRFIFICINDESVPVPDVLWGQLYKTE